MAAAVILQGLTAHFLAHSVHSLSDSDRILIHGGAGGVNVLLTQYAKKAGALVITTVSNAAKSTISKQAGADYVLYHDQDLVKTIDALTNGNGISVVYDGIGQSTLQESLAVLAPKGLFVLYGQASGPVPPIDLTILHQKSLFVTRPAFAHYVSPRQVLLNRVDTVLHDVLANRLQLTIDRKYPLSEAAESHRRLESRHAIGKILLIP